MTEFRVARMLIGDGKIKHNSIRVILLDEMVDGDIGSFRQRREKALSVVNEWNRMAAWNNLEEGVWHYYLI